MHVILILLNVTLKLALVIAANSNATYTYFNSYKYAYIYTHTYVPHSGYNNNSDVVNQEQNGRNSCSPLLQPLKSAPCPGGASYRGGRTGSDENNRITP